MNSTSNNTPEYKVVGSTCLGSFLNTTTPEEVVSLFEALADAVSAGEESEGGGGSGGDFTHFGLDNYLGYVAAVIRNDGWMSRTQARNMYNNGGAPIFATADTAWGVMVKVALDDTREINPKYLPTKEDFARATNCLDFLRVFVDKELEKGELNDYLYNLNIACRMGDIDFKASGIVASIIATVAREEGKEIERRKFSNLKETSKHFAAEGDKVVAFVTLMAQREIEGQYGCTTMLKFVSSEGNAITWFASGSFSDGTWVTGNTYILAGTVKKNDDYQGTKQTLMTRCNAVTQEWVDGEKVKAAKKAARAAKKAQKALTTNP